VRKIKIKNENDDDHQIIVEEIYNELLIKRKTPFYLSQEIDRKLNKIWNEFDDFIWWPLNKRRWFPLSLEIIESEPFFRTPLVNIIENDKGYILNAEVPGLKHDDIDVLVKNGILEIRGKYKGEKSEAKEGILLRREYHTSSFFRCFKLPENIDDTAIEAILEDGILNVKIPKKFHL